MRVGCHFLLQGFCLAQKLNPLLFHCRWVVFFFLKPLSHLGSPIELTFPVENIQKLEVSKNFTKNTLLGSWKPSYTNSRLPRWHSGKNPSANTGDRRPEFNSWVGKISWRRNGNTLLSSCLGSRMEREAWRAMVYGVTEELDTPRQLNNRKLCRMYLWGLSEDCVAY